MADNIACNVCGGKQFHKEFGFYYCNECQTQSQDIQERVFAVEEKIDGEAVAKVRSAKKIQTQKKSDERLTSWECYNYILRGLVDELIQLGADVRLKKTVHVLWFRYLKTLEVISSDDEHPKLNAFNSKIDAEILYGTTEKRKRSTPKRIPCPPSTSDGVADSSMTRTERSRNKRNFILSEYDVLSATLQSEDTSLYNQSLTNLKSSKDISKDISKDTDKYLHFNKFAKKELMKKQLKDVNSIHDCHKMTYRSFTTPFVSGPAVISRVKIYALLYLGLLINKDNIQLGDLIRFVREGQLSYHYVRHFFPEDLDEKMLNIKNWNEKQSVFVHHAMRGTTAALAHFLDVTSCVPIQNLPHLCRRYCKELNLPDDTWAYCINLIGRVYPKMEFTKQSQLIPNYEGRVLSIIIFILKLMFGLDGETEEHFSDFAQKINDLPENTGNGKMFVWNDWMYYIKYRKLILLQNHFPTTNFFCGENADVLETSTNFLTGEYVKMDSEEQLSRKSEILKTLLEKFRDTYCYMPQKTTFESSITPYRSYVETLINLNIVSESSGYLVDVLQSDFSNDSWRFLVHSFQYIKELYNDCKVSLKHRGANNDIEMVEFKSVRAEKSRFRKYSKKDVLVQVSSKTTSYEHKLLRKSIFAFEDGITRTNSEDILRNYNERNMSSFKKHKKKQLNSFKKHENYSRDFLMLHTSSHSESKSDDNSLHFHYNPYERYWLKSLNATTVSNKDFLMFFKTFPKSFRDVMSECSRISEQEPKELFDEFNDVEIYLCYVAKFSSSEKKEDKVTDQILRRLITKSIKKW